MTIMAAGTASNAGAFNNMGNRTQLYHEFALKINKEFAQPTGQVADAEAVKSRIKKLKETANNVRRCVQRKAGGAWGRRWPSGARAQCMAGGVGPHQQLQACLLPTVEGGPRILKLAWRR
jgi:hypothetical protein